MVNFNVLIIQQNWNLFKNGNFVIIFSTSKYFAQKSNGFQTHLRFQTNFSKNLKITKKILVFFSALIEKVYIKI